MKTAEEEEEEFQELRRIHAAEAEKDRELHLRVGYTWRSQQIRPHIAGEKEFEMEIGDLVKSEAHPDKGLGIITKSIKGYHTNIITEADIASTWRRGCLPPKGVVVTWINSCTETEFCWRGLRRRNISDLECVSNLHERNLNRFCKRWGNMFKRLSEIKPVED